MPYRKKYYKKGVAKKAVAKARKKNFERKVKAVIQKEAEHKFVDGTSPDISFDAAAVPGALIKPLVKNTCGELVQGTNHNQRLGDKVHLHSYHMKGLFVPGAQTGAYRFILGQVLDSQDPDAPTVTYGNLFSNIVTGASDYTAITALPNTEPQVKWKALHDEVITIDSNASSAPRLMDIKINQNQFRQRYLNYDGLDTIHNGMLFYMAVSGNGASATIQDIRSKLTYTDV